MPAKPDFVGVNGIRVLSSGIGKYCAPLLGPTLNNLGLASELNAITHNTATPTGLAAGQKTNVIPSHAEAVIDCRTVPGFGASEIVQELRIALGTDAAPIIFEVESESQGIEFTTDTPLYRTIRQTLKQLDPTGIPIPSMLTGATDAKHMVKLGTICYGFSPMRFKPGERFSDMVHGHDERVSIDSLSWGVRALYKVVSEFTRAL